MIPFENQTLDGSGFGALVDEVRGDDAFQLLALEVGEPLAHEVVDALSTIVDRRARSEAVHILRDALAFLSRQSTVCAALVHLTMPTLKSLEEHATELGCSKQAVHKQQQKLVERIKTRGDEVPSWIRDAAEKK